MDIILQKDIKNLGKAGDRVSVKPGYARNYLLPKKLALVLDENRLGEWKHKQRIIEARKKKALQERNLLLEKLSSIHLTFEREGQTGGRLFGSISPVDISRELEQKHHLSVDKRDIATEPLKTVGDHPVKIALDSERQTEIKVTIKRIITEKDKKKKTSVSSTTGRKEKQHTKETGENADTQITGEKPDSQEPTADQSHEVEQNGNQTSDSNANTPSGDNTD